MTSHLSFDSQEWKFQGRASPGASLWSAARHQHTQGKLPTTPAPISEGSKHLSRGARFFTNPQRKPKFTRSGSHFRLILRVTPASPSSTNPKLILAELQRTPRPRTAAEMSPGEGREMSTGPSSTRWLPAAQQQVMLTQGHPQDTSGWRAARCRSTGCTQVVSFCLSCKVFPRAKQTCPIC